MKYAILTFLMLALCLTAYAEGARFRSSDATVTVEAYCESCLPTADFLDSAQVATAGRMILDVTVTDSASGKICRLPITASALAEYIGKNKNAVGVGTVERKNVRLFMKMMKDFKVTQVARRDMVTNDELQQKGGEK